MSHISKWPDLNAVNLALTRFSLEQVDLRRRWNAWIPAQLPGRKLLPPSLEGGTS